MIAWTHSLEMLEFCHRKCEVNCHPMYEVCTLLVYSHPLHVWISPLRADSLACNINIPQGPAASSYADILVRLLMAPLLPLTEVVLLKRAVNICSHCKSKLFSLLMGCGNTSKYPYQTLTIGFSCSCQNLHPRSPICSNKSLLR